MEFKILEVLTHEELIEACLVAAKKKNKKLARAGDVYVKFRWGDQMDNIYATIDAEDIQPDETA